MPSIFDGTSASFRPSKRAKGGLLSVAAGGIIASSLVASGNQVLISSKGTGQLLLNVGDGGNVVIGSDKAPIVAKGVLQVHKKILLKGEDENHGIQHGVLQRSGRGKATQRSTWPRASPVCPFT